jgi:Putative helicase/Putative conjugal transfer nickase/helicase TraI C-term
LFDQQKRFSHKNVARAKLHAVLPPESLLAEDRRQGCIKNIEIHLGLPAKRYQQMVLPLLKEVAVGCQLLPSTQHPFYTQSGGLLDYALFRAKSAIMLFRLIALPPDTVQLSEEQSLWAYVLLSASLLRGMGTVCTNFSIDLHNQNGNLLGTWNPLWERFIDRGNFYHIHEIPEPLEELSQHVTPLIARLWMPQNGFSWISSNQEALLSWLKMLQEETEGLSLLEAILERAEALAWQELSELMLAHGAHGKLNVDARTPSFIDAPTPDNLELQRIGLEFIKWLNEAIARGQMMINQSPLIAQTNGILLSSEAFKWFLQHHPHFKNWRLIQKAVMSLNIHIKDDQNLQIHNRQKSENDGVLIHKLGILLPKEVLCRQIQQNLNFRIKSMALTQKQNWDNFVHGKEIQQDFLNKQLNAEGEWVTYENSHELSPGIKNG